MILPFFSSPDFDFAARTALGHAALGTSDIGPILEALSRIADGDAAGWYAAWRTRPIGCVPQRTPPGRRGTT